MNTTIFYRVEGWEEDTDALLLQLPIVGCAFRKVCWKDGQFHISLRPALKIVAPMKAKDVESSPRLTEIIDDIFPYEIADRMAAGQYRQVELTPESDDDQAPRTLLEQHRLMDMDGDGVSEPYIVTVDKATSEVLRVESNFSTHEAMQPGIRVKKLSVYYIKYDFFPHPKGCFYGIGFGHLLDPITEVVNTAINQLIDAGTAQIAGGGFIAGGVRLQGNSSRIKLQPGEFKTVNGVTGSQLREAIFERTVPQPSPIAFQLLDMMLGAAKDISSVKDVITGEASNNGQVGTTMALIEQGLQVFTAIYKRVYRSLKGEFTMLFEQMGRWGGDAMAQDYQNVLDDPLADFQGDFNGADFDIRPVSDPTSVTKMQKMSRAQFLGGFIGRGLNDIEIYRRMFEAADVEDIDKILPDGPPPPNPKDVADAQVKQADAALKQAQTVKTEAETALMGFNAGAMNDLGGVPGMAGAPGNPMGAPGG
jgi:chaperonin GroES